MTRGTRAALTVIAAFVTYRILVVWMPFATAVLLGVLVGIATNLLTKPRESSEEPEESEESEED
jgi:predicted branched-subunit amino acid permease